jgi:hypothetical protein
MVILNYFLLILVISPKAIFNYCKFFWVFYVIFGYYKLFQFKLLATIINYFSLLNVISPYVIISNYRLL